MKDHFYLRVKRNGRDKKELNFGGKHWGDMKKAKANARAIPTGNGLWVLDLDKKDMKVYPKKLRKLLPIKPTMETANGYHYYFKGEGLSQTQKLIDHVDIRNEGGFVFDKYWGEDDAISYKKIGTTTTPSRKLMKYLEVLKGQQRIRDIDTLELNYVDGEPWKQFEDGEQHTMLMATMIKMFNDRKSEDEVWSRASEYQDNFLSGDGYNVRHETNLMRGRFQWAVSQISNGKIKGNVLDKAPTIKEAKETAKQKKKKAKQKGGSRGALMKRRLTKEKAEARANQRMLVPNLIAHGLHLYLYGASGAFKTTIMAKLAVDMAVNGMDVDYWAFDPSAQQSSALERMARKRGVKDRLLVIADESIDFFKDTYNDALDAEEDMRNRVIVLDTYKFFSGDVNNKNANKEALHYIKDLQRLGATFISIGHTNKDGKDRSGTAETEQDTDAMMRVDAVQDESTQTAFVTISKHGHRVRYETRDVTFTIDITKCKDFAYNSLKSVKTEAKAVDISKMNDEKDKVDKDKAVLTMFCKTLYQAGGTMAINDVHEALSYAYSSKTSIVRVIDKWDEKAWTRSLEMREGSKGTKHQVVVITLNEEFPLKYGLRLK